MEILPDKVLTTPSVASLGSASVMLWAKRRQLGSRAKGQFSIESHNQWADVVAQTESNIWVYRYGEISHTTAVFEECQSCYTMILCQLGRAYVPLIMSAMRYDVQQKKKEIKWNIGSRIAE